MSTGKRYKFFGSKFEVGTGFGSPITVTGASAASPVVLTATQSLDQGDVVVLDGFDAPAQLDGGTYVVDDPSGSNFELFNVDGSDYDAFDAGTPSATATPWTFMEFCELTASNQQDGAPTEEDVSTICSTAKEFEQGLSDSGTLQLDYNWAGNEAVQAALKAAKISGDQIPFRITVGADGIGGIVVMIGTVQTTSMSGGVGQAVWKGSATIKLSGEIAVFEPGMKLAELLAAMDSMAVEKPRALHIKGLGDVYIREITIGEIDAQIADTADKKDKRGVARSACRLLADENGVRLLDPDNPEHVERMAKLPLRVLTAINKAAELDEAQAEGN